MGVDLAGVLIVTRKSAVCHFETKCCEMDLSTFSSSEIAAWLAENGPISVALNAFAMQVNTYPPQQWLHDSDSTHCYHLHVNKYINR